MKDQPSPNSAVAIYPNNTMAETAVKELQHAGFDMRKLSIIGRDYHTEENVTGYYTLGDRMRKWGTFDAFWGGVWGLLFGAAFFWVPGIGQILVAGPLVAIIVAVLEDAIVVGGLSALGAALFNMGVPKDSVLKYEKEIKADKFLLIAHGTPAEVERAREILTRSGAGDAVVHAMATA
jgi:hypothetical protein